MIVWKHFTHVSRILPEHLAKYLLVVQSSRLSVILRIIHDVSHVFFGSGVGVSESPRLRLHVIILLYNWRTLLVEWGVECLGCGYPPFFVTHSRVRSQALVEVIRAQQALFRFLERYLIWFLYKRSSHASFFLLQVSQVGLLRHRMFCWKVSFRFHIRVNILWDIYLQIWF